MLKTSSFLLLPLLSQDVSARVVTRQSGEWTVGLDPIQAVITQDNNGAFSFECQTNGQTVITASKIGLSTDSGDLGPDFQECNALDQSEDTVEYDTPVGRTTHRSATYITQSFECKTDDGKDVQLDVRVGVDGCAFRAKIPEGQYKVTAETHTWTFAQNGESYLVSTYQHSCLYDLAD